MCLQLIQHAKRIRCIALYFRLWPVWHYHIFPHCLINGTIFTIFKKNKLFFIKCVFQFSLQLLSETFLILRRVHRDIAINVTTDPNYLFILLFLLCTVYLSFSTLYSNNGIQVIRGSVWLVRLASGTQVCGFKPGRSRWIFRT